MREISKCIHICFLSIILQILKNILQLLIIIIIDIQVYRFTFVPILGEEVLIPC